MTLTPSDAAALSFALTAIMRRRPRFAYVADHHGYGEQAQQQRSRTGLGLDRIDREPEQLGGRDRRSAEAAGVIWVEEDQILDGDRKPEGDDREIALHESGALGPDHRASTCGAENPGDQARMNGHPWAADRRPATYAPIPASATARAISWPAIP